MILLFLILKYSLELSLLVDKEVSKELIISHFQGMRISTLHFHYQIFTKLIECKKKIWIE